MSRLPAVLLAALLALAGPVPAAQAAPTTERIAGEDRYDTAARLSAATYPDGAQVVWVATGEGFADALTAAAGAGAARAPVLLVARDAVPDATARELRRLAAQDVVLVGGPAAVSERVEQSLRELAGRRVTRLSGGDRYATAATVSRTRFAGPVERVLVVTGRDFPDALAAAPAAAGTGAGLLLVAPTAVPAATAAEIERLDPQAITVVGGAGAVSPAVEQQLRSAAPSVDRVQGVDRFLTAAAVSGRTSSPPEATVYLATGADFPDALAGAAAAGASGSPLLLVRRDCVPAGVAREVERLQPDRVVVLGGEAVVSAGAASGMPCPPEPEPHCAASVADPSPPVAGRQTVHVSSDLLEAPVVVRVRYRSSTSTYETATDAYGSARVSFDVDGAFPGYTAPVEVGVGDRATCATEFTAR